MRSPEHSRIIEESESLIAEWFAKNKGTSRVGIANTGLVVLEQFREGDISEESIITKGGSQVSGLSGEAAMRVIRKYLPTARDMGTEAGRTSRNTPRAARELIQLLDQLSARIGGHPDEAKLREALVDSMQRWLAFNPISQYYSRQRIRPELHLHDSPRQHIASIIAAAAVRGQSGQVVQHLVGAKLQIRYPDASIPNHSYSTADSQTGRPGDFLVGDTAFHVTVSPSAPLIEKCVSNLRDGYRVVAVVSENMKDAMAQLLTLRGIDTRVSVLTVESFISQNIDELSNFDSKLYRENLAELLETYNRRVEEAEPDASLQIAVPKNL